MDLYLSEIFNTITAFPGNLTYHLIVSFSIGGALYIAYQNWRASRFPQARRMVVGLSLLLTLRLVFFLTSLTLFVLRSNADIFLPPFDRTINALSLLLLVWLWAFPEPTRRWDTVFAILGCLIFLVAGFTLVNWSILFSSAVSQQTEIYFNQTLEINSAWEVISLALSICGIVLLAIRRPNSWGVGIMMLSILGIGHFAHLLYPTVGLHFAGPVRLVQLAAYPMLLALPGRFVSPSEASLADSSPVLTVERRSYGAEADTFRAFTALVTETDEAALCEAYTRTISNLLLADICLLIVLNEKDLAFECGYDLIREQSFPGTSFSEQDLPLLASALERNKTLRLPASSTSPDLKSLSHSLETDRIGHLLAAPIPYQDDEPITGIVLLSPYSNRPWNTLDEEYLIEVAASLADIAHNNRILAQRDREIQELQSKILSGPDATNSYEQFETIHEWDWDTEDEVGFSASAVTAATLSELITSHEDAQDTISTLQAEIDDLNNQFEQTSNPASLAAIAAEIRQPINSIQEYTDLLLTGQFGELEDEEQRYLQRIRASSERIEATIAEASASYAIPINGITGNGPVNLYELIDEAIDFTKPQLREKNIAIHVDLPDQLPELGVDREALQQILIFLLQNAGDATPLNGEIALHASSEDNMLSDTEILLQITDAGGGIADDDLPNIFKRVANSEGAGIQGVGGKGVGLSVAKNLIEDQHGKIWVDSRPGDGATFNVILPSYLPSTNGGPDFSGPR